MQLSWEVLSRKQPFEDVTNLQIMYSVSGHVPAINEESLPSTFKAYDSNRKWMGHKIQMKDHFLKCLIELEPVLKNIEERDYS